ncbi:alanine racemase [Leptospira sp. 96542]|nr:alanine racemase [Leptospira sp. 96542]
MSSSTVYLSRSAISHNIALFRKLIGPKSKFTAVVKSNAYGHGLIETATMALGAGADLLAVNSVEEAKRLRVAFPKTIILIMGSIPSLETVASSLSDENFWILVSRIEELEILSKLSPTPKLHLKVNTGMSRLGISYEDAELVAKEIFAKKLPLNGIATHFASTEDFTEHSHSMLQLERFQKVIHQFEKHGFIDLVCHCASSASAMLFAEARMDLVRVGISLYGLWPSLETKLSLSLMKKEVGSLKPALTWKTKIQHIQELPQGSFVGYGSTYKTTHPTKLAVVPVGYYEGLNRKLSNSGYMLVAGERAKILGRICMNMTMLDITNIPETKIGDDVIIIGKSGEETVTADDHATWTGTINYEVVTKILDSFPRVIVD